MCGRFAFYSPHEAVVRLFGLPDDTPAIEPRYNIAPTTFIPAVRELPDRRRPTSQQRGVSRCSTGGWCRSGPRKSRSAPA